MHLCLHKWVMKREGNAEDPKPNQIKTLFINNLGKGIKNTDTKIEVQSLAKNK